MTLKFTSASFRSTDVALDGHLGTQNTFTKLGRSGGGCILSKYYNNGIALC